MGDLVGKNLKFIVMKGLYKGKNVTLMNPSRIRPGQPTYGRKKFQVYVMDNNRIKRANNELLLKCYCVIFK